MEIGGYSFCHFFRYDAEDGEVIRFENIMEKGFYIIKIYNKSKTENIIDLRYGTY